jgi:hypothetical protein
VSSRANLRSLTELLVWNNIETKMVEYMEDVRTRRLKEEQSCLINARRLLFVQVFKDYIATRPVVEANPGPADVYKMDKFKTIVEDTPKEAAITSESFQEVVERLPLLCDQWRTARNMELIAIIEKSLKHQIATKSETRLDLATTFFQWYVSPLLWKDSAHNIFLVVAVVANVRNLSHTLAFSCMDAWSDITMLEVVMMSSHNYIGPCHPRPGTSEVPNWTLIVMPIMQLVLS